jgi:hypothetical protein
MLPVRPTSVAIRYYCVGTIAFGSNHSYYSVNMPRVAYDMLNQECYKLFLAYLRSETNLKNRQAELSKCSGCAVLLETAHELVTIRRKELVDHCRRHREHCRFEKGVARLNSQNVPRPQKPPVYLYLF